MALSGLRADYEIGKFGITPSQVAALKNLATPPDPGMVAPTVYSPTGGGGALNRPSAPLPQQQQPPEAPQAAASTTQPQVTTNQRAASTVQQPPAQILAARWLTGGGQPAAQAAGTTPPMIQGQPASFPATSPKPFQSTLSNGITFSGAPNGGRVFTMGTPGTDGSGKVIAHGRTSPSVGQPQDQAALSLSGMQSAPIQGENGPYSFQGSAADALKFAQPVATPARVVMGQVSGGGDYRDIRDRHEAAKANLMQAPQYLGPESGLGWHTREKLYDTQMDAYNKATGNKTAMDIEAMREAGAGRRAILAASGEGERSALERQRLGLDQQRFSGEQGVRNLDMQGKQMELNALTQVEALQKKYDATNDPAEKRQIARDIMVKSGKQDTSKYQIVTRKEPDPKNPGMEIQKNYAVNPDDPSQSFEIGGGGQDDAPLLPEIGKRVAGKTYTSPSGKKAVWDGKGLILQQ